MDYPLKRKSLFLLSIADILFLSVFLYLSFHTGKGLLADGDTGYHIRAGEYIIDTLSIPKQDIFSFISPALPWTAHEWLSEVIMASVHRAFGLTGIVIFFSFIISAVYFIFFKIIRTYTGNILAAILVAILAIAASQIHWLARPHIFSMLLIVIWYYLLDMYQYRDRDYLYLMPLIMLLWANLHGGFMSGFILLGIYFAGNFMKSISSAGVEKLEHRKKVVRLGLITLFCLAATLVNPYGYHILLFPFKLTSDKFIMDNVSEFISPNFHEPMPFTCLLLLIIAVFSVSKKALNIIEVMLMLLFTYMALYSARYIPIFAIIAAPVLVKQTEFVMMQSRVKVMDFIDKRASRIKSVDASATGYIWPAAAVILIVILAAGGKIKFGFDEKIKAVAAVEFLKKEPLKGNMFNNDEFGDYIIYAAWPEYKVFFDGRSDMYGAERMKEYFKITRIETGWEDVLKKYDINWIIYNDKSTLSQFLLQRDDWKLIYADKVANIFVKNKSDNQFLIEKYKNIRPVVK